MELLALVEVVAKWVVLWAPLVAVPQKMPMKLVELQEASLLWPPLQEGSLELRRERQTLAQMASSSTTAQLWASLESDLR